MTKLCLCLPLSEQIDPPPEMAELRITPETPASAHLSLISLSLNSTPLLAFRGFSEQSALEAAFEKHSIPKEALIDIEYPLEPPGAFSGRLVISHHDFKGTPENLGALVAQMAERHPNALLKVAAMANSTLDALRMIQYARRFNRQRPRLIGISMGEFGVISRILSPLTEAPWTYCALAQGLETAPGQLSCKELAECYRFHKLNRDTFILGLIGGIVAHSSGHILHNAIIEQKGLNGVYVKMSVQENELAEFFTLAKALPIRGLSVTMPLKQVVIPHLDWCESSVEASGACNTIAITAEGSLLGYNTDGLGALDALESVEKVRGKKLIVLGAGGAARALVYEAVMRGAHAAVFNRTREKAAVLGEHFKIAHGALEDFEKHARKGYDFLVNCTSVGMTGSSEEYLVDPRLLLPQSVVMDAVYKPEWTPLLSAAKERGCRVVRGKEWLKRQAIAQWACWKI